jgi:hypothetical protein
LKGLVKKKSFLQDFHGRKKILFCSIDGGSFDGLYQFTRKAGYCEAGKVWATVSGVLMSLSV